MLSEGRGSPKIFWDQINRSVSSHLLLIYTRISVHTIFIVRCLSQGWPYMLVWRGSHSNHITLMPQDLAFPSLQLWCHTKIRPRSSSETEGKINFKMTDFCVFCLALTTNASLLRLHRTTSVQYQQFSHQTQVLLQKQARSTSMTKICELMRLPSSNDKWLDESNRTPQRHHLNARSYNNNIQNQ